jgi:tetratricopeptide (TPR) repeat protein
VTCSALIKVINLWRADYHYARGEKLNKMGQSGQAFQELSNATNLNPGEPVYQNEIAEAAASLALLSLQQNDLSNASKFTRVAIFESQQALKTSPKNLNFWKGQVKVFYLLAQADKNYLPKAIESLDEAIKLAPTDAKLLYNLGIVYGYNKQEEAAAEAFRQAIDLKPNYKDARFALAVYLEEKGKIQEAKEQLEYILKNLAPNDSASAQLLKELK